MSRFLTILLVFMGLRAGAQTGRTVTGSIHAGGLVRDYRLYVPAAYRPGLAVPLLFNLHGYGSTNLSQEATANFAPIADTANFLVVSPNGSLEPGTGYRFWNTWEAPGTGGPDDTAFLAALLDTLAQRYTLDPDRIYYAGYSNGGFMSYELACHLGPRIAAVASVCGSISALHFGSCAPTHPTPVLEIHGTGDTNVQYNGGSWYAAVPTVLAYWIQQNGCVLAAGTTTPVPDRDPTDQSTAEHSVWRGPRAGAVVEHFRILNGGHVWPGGPPSSTDVVNRDISASQEIWRFLRRYRLSQLALATAPAAAPLPHFSVYPNPAPGTGLVQLSTAPYLLQVCDALGRPMPLHHTPAANGTAQLDVSAWPAGVYLLRASTRAGQSSWVKLVK